MSTTTSNVSEQIPFNDAWEKIRDTMPPGQLDFNQLAQMKTICEHFYSIGWNASIEAMRTYVQEEGDEPAN